MSKSLKIENQSERKIMSSGESRFKTKLYKNQKSIKIENWTTFKRDMRIKLIFFSGMKT